MSVVIISIILPTCLYLLSSYFSWQLFIFSFIYGMFFMSTHATVWYHRYATHKAFKFTSPFWRFITSHLVIKTVPEETYVISHHVHHLKSDLPGDPYNPLGGFLYCMLADFNHQNISKDLSEDDYRRTSQYLSGTGIKLNSYKQYLKYGSVSSPWYTIVSTILNWCFWYTAFFYIGYFVKDSSLGHGIALSAFVAAFLWFILVRAFNYTGHGNGKDKHVDGVDFDRRNLSINQVRPGYFSGEWHNNHHLYPQSARAGFLSYQLDMAWVYIWSLKQIGAVNNVQNDKDKFLEKYYNSSKTTDSYNQ